MQHWGSAAALPLHCRRRRHGNHKYEASGVKSPAEAVPAAIAVAVLRNKPCPFEEQLCR